MKKILISSIVVANFLFGADFTNSFGMKFKEIPSGSFIMGTSIPTTTHCPKDNPFTTLNEYNNCVDSVKANIKEEEAPAHPVKIKSFYLSETEVTQGQWYKIMGANPSMFQTGDANMPVEQVSWYDAKIFIKNLNEKEGGNKYRLPTEEEWEYAARAGTTTKWSCGDNENCVDNIAWYGNAKAGQTTHPVKRKKSNAFGLYDMHGNVWEWTENCWTKNYNSEENCNDHSLRGGSWGNYADDTRSATRTGLGTRYIITNSLYNSIGLRVLMDK